MSGIGIPPPRTSVQGGNGPSQYGGFAGSNPAVYTIYQIEAHMKKAFLITLLATCFSANAESPYDQFNVSKFKTKEFNLVIQYADDIQKACNEENVKRGFKAFNFKLEACSFLRVKNNSTQCLVILPTASNYHILGHEIRHCADGNFH